MISLPSLIFGAEKRSHDDFEFTIRDKGNKQQHFRHW